MHISPSDEYILGDEDISILLTSDNGCYFTEGELLFKLHHAMIPYPDRLKEHTIAVILSCGYCGGVYAYVPMGGGRGNSAV